MKTTNTELYYMFYFGSRPAEKFVPQNIYDIQLGIKKGLTRPFSSIATASKLHPQYVTGFSDAEGSFGIKIRKNSKLLTGWEVKPVFAIRLHRKDIMLIQQLQSYFGVGSIFISNSDESATLSVRSTEDITKVIIPHFDSYPLLTQKQADFLLFKLAIELIKNKEHLTVEGLNKIVALKGSINWGLSELLKIAFPNVVPMDRPLIENQVIKDSNWLAGFTEGEACFIVDIYKSKTTKTGFAIKLKFSLTQHSRDERLLKHIVEYLGCGYYFKRPNKLAGDYIVVKFSDIVTKIIPFLDKYPLVGAKRQDYLDFCKVASLMKTKVHLTNEGLEQIRQIKSGMNSGRSY